MGNPEFLHINLRRRLESRGWSLKRFSIEAGVSYHTVFRTLSKGIIPRGGNLQKMAKALDASIADLYAQPTESHEAPALRTVGEMTPDELAGFLKNLQKPDVPEGFDSGDREIISLVRLGGPSARRKVVDFLKALLAADKPKARAAGPRSK